MSLELIKKKILIVDDERDMLELVKVILIRAGYDVTTDLNGETVEIIKKDYPNLIILDVSMSGKDGRDICRHLKSKEATRNIPILFLSANNDLELLAEQAGADDYLSKPFSINALLRKLEVALKAA
jgi:CheY-like chemotaxis protein